MAKQRREVLVERTYLENMGPEPVGPNPYRRPKIIAGLSEAQIAGLTVKQRDMIRKEVEEGLWEALADLTDEQLKALLRWRPAMWGRRRLQRNPTPKVERQ